MKTIPLTQGRMALVDDADFEWLNRFKWYAGKDHHTFYAKRYSRLTKNKQTTQSMHRQILGLQSDDRRQCDHRDGDGLNNQRANLRVCTSTQNNQSSKKKRVSMSRFKGVSWHRRACKWCPQIRINGKKTHLGCFNLEVAAARVYDAAALKYHGEYAMTNEMLGLYQKE